MFYVIEVDQGNITLVDADNNAIGTYLDGDVRRLEVRIKPAVPDDLTSFVRKSLIDSSDSSNLLVDGSSSPVEFNIFADTIKNININEICFVISCDVLRMEGDKFGAIDVLTNGILFQVRSNGTTTDLAVVRITEEFLTFPGSNPFFDRGGPVEVMAFNFTFGGSVTLHAGTGDFVKLTIRDDLSSSKFKYFQACLTGVKV